MVTSLNEESLEALIVAQMTAGDTAGPPKFPRWVAGDAVAQHKRDHDRRELLFGFGRLHGPLRRR